MRCIPPNQTQCFRALLHHVCLTWGSVQTYPNGMYPLIKPSAYSPTTPCLFDMWKHADIPKWDVSPLIKPSQGPTTLCLFDMWKYADIPKWDVSPLIELSDSEPYYTISIWHVEAYRHTQMRCIPPNQTQCFRALLHHVCLTWGSVQTYPNGMYPLIKSSAYSPTTPCLFDMWKHADIPKWDVSPLIKPSQGPTTLCLFDMWKYADIMRCIPPYWTQWFRTLLHHIHLTWGSVQTYPNKMYPP